MKIAELQVADVREGARRNGEAYNIYLFCLMDLMLKEYNTVLLHDERRTYIYSNAHCAPQMKEPNHISTPLKIAT